MSTMKLFTTSLFLLLFSSFFAQDMKVNFSDKMVLKLNKDGFVKSFIGETEKHVYVEFQSSNKKKEVVINRIGVFDKETMKEVNSLVIADKRNDERTSELDGKLKKAIFFISDRIYILYTEESKSELSVFAEAYSLNLDKDVKMKKLITYAKESKKDYVFPSVIFNQSKIVLATLDNQKNDIKFNYTVFDHELEELGKSSVNLPQPKGIQDEDIFSLKGITLDNNDNFYFNETYSIKAGEKRSGLFYKTIEYKYEFYISILSIETGEVQMFDMNDENTSLFNIKVLEVGDKVRILGFFSDFNKDPKGERTHGFCYRELDPITLEFSDMVYSYFDKALLDELFKEDQEDKLQTNAKKKDQEEATARDQDALSKSFVIEKVKTDSKGNLILFCSKMNNYSYQVCSTDANGRTTCRTVYKCEKNNVTVFKLNNEGEFIWSSNIDRRKTYDGWDIYDLRVIENEDSYIVTYGSSYQVNAEEKTKKTRKKAEESIDQLEYGVFDKETGSNEKKLVRINEEGVKKSDKKFCSATAITPINNKYYVLSSRKRIAPWIFSTCLCPPVFLVLGVFTNVGQIQDAHIGKIELVD